MRIIQAIAKPSGILAALAVLGWVTAHARPIDAARPKGAEYTKVSFSGRQDAGERVQVSFDGLLSGPLVDMTTDKQVRFIVFTQVFIRDRDTLGRALLHRVIDESRLLEPLTSRLTVNPDPHGTADTPLALYSVSIQPAAGKTWWTVAQYEDLQVEVEKVR